MQLSSSPTKITLPWAASASAPYINTVPVASQIGVTPGRASWTDGFVPLNATLRASGGVPPFIGDMNGGLNEVSAGLQWLQAGATMVYDATFSAAIGGYRNGALVQSASTSTLFWVSTADNNASNPDAGGANWVGFSFAATGILGRTQVFLTSGTFTWPPGVTAAEVWGWGPGGAGGASSDGTGNIAGTAGCGGGSGGMFYARVSGQTPGSTTAVTIGAAGTGVANAAVTGGSGTATSFGAIATGNGGLGGSSGRNANILGGAGGSASGGVLNIAGGQGGTGGPAATFDAVMPLHVYNKGGMAPYAVGTLNWFGTGVAPNGFCSGGSGASGGSAVAGGNGGPGLMIVRW